MRIRSLLILAVISLISVTTIASFGGTIAVGQDGYYVPDWGHSVGDITVSPSAGACRGQQILVTGSGAAGNSIIDVSMVSDGWHPGMLSIPEDPPVFLNLGTAVSDSSGAWSLLATVPREINPGSPYATTVQSGLWVVYSKWLPDYAGYTVKQDALTVLDCTVSDAGKLPATGFPASGLYLAGGCLLLIMGICLRARGRAI